jgi:trimeric autotransporter adhesin
MRTATRMVVLNSKKYALDLISAVVAAAYGLRRLYSLWTGAAIRVQRSLDDAKADIGFTANGDLDTVALLAFVGSGNGFIITWYDQSGNGRHATQTDSAHQSKIVSNGVIETQNGRPALLFDGINDFFAMTSPINSVNATINAVSKLSKTMGGHGAYILGSQTPIGLLGYDDESLGLRIYSSSGGYFTSPLPAAVRSAASVDTVVITSNVAALHRYGVSIAGTQTIGDNFQPTIIGAFANASNALFRHWGGTLSEITVFGSSISTTDRQTLERDQGLYFNISVS